VPLGGAHLRERRFLDLLWAVRPFRVNDTRGGSGSASGPGGAAGRPLQTRGDGHPAAVAAGTQKGGKPEYEFRRHSVV
jgi:hypothetical protein